MVSISIMRAKDVEINESITPFLRDKRIKEAIALREMGRNNFSWSLSVLSELVDRENPHPNDLFNYAWCKKRLGINAIDDFRKFLKSTDKLSPERFGPSMSINYYACLGLASIEVGEENKAERHFNMALEKIEKLDVEEVFSPYSYKEEKKEKIKDEILHTLSSMKEQE